MRARAWSVVVLLAVGCGGVREVREEPLAQPLRTPRFEAPISPQHGGTLAQLGDHTLELSVHASGEIAAHARTEGALGDAGLTVTIRDAEGTPHAVATRWHALGRMFVGELGAAAGTGEATLLLMRADDAWTASMNVADLLSAPQHGGTVIAAGPHRVEVRVTGSGRVEAYVEGGEALEVTVALEGEGATLHPLALAWSAETRRHEGRLEGLAPRPGLLVVRVSSTAGTATGRGLLRAVHRVADASEIEVPTDLSLELPSLGRDLPRAIVIDGTAPPAE